MRWLHILVMFGIVICVGYLFCFTKGSQFISLILMTAVGYWAGKTEYKRKKKKEEHDEYN